jgi:hypothetical protein
MILREYDFVCFFVPSAICQFLLRSSAISCRLKGLAWCRAHLRLCDDVTHDEPPRHPMGPDTSSDLLRRASRCSDAQNSDVKKPQRWRGAASGCDVFELISYRDVNLLGACPLADCGDAASDSVSPCLVSRGPPAAPTLGALSF